MPFVIKLTSRIGGVSWLSAANRDGSRTPAARESADVFRTYEDGNIAIRKLPRAFEDVGLIFSVKSVD
jgi:hypothetical protein